MSCPKDVRTPGLGRPLVGACLLILASVAASATPAEAQQSDEEHRPDGSFAPDCADGEVTSIDLERGTMFDPDSTGVALLAWGYRAMNVLHVRTQPSFIRRELLFEVGDCYDEFLVRESERLLDGYGFLGTALIRSEDDGRGGREVVVQTRDEWSTQVDVGVTYDERVNLEKLEVSEENFLGHGIFAEFTHHERREIRAQSFRLSTPRLFGRTDASIELGRDRPGRFFSQHLRYPFIGETGRFSVRQGYDRGTTFYAYSMPRGGDVGQVVAPAFREVVELSAAQRFGERGRSIIAGVTLSREVNRFGAPRAAVGGDLDELQPLADPLPAMSEQLGETGATRVWLHVGARRLRYDRYEGLDGLRDRLLVGLGYFGGVSVGRGFDALVPSDVRGLNDFFVRANGNFTVPVGTSVPRRSVDRVPTLERRLEGHPDGRRARGLSQGR